MGYRDDLYNTKNIIGYTGRIKHNPTVYFKKKVGDAAPGYVEVGHITQQHNLTRNIGREAVLMGKDYKIVNVKSNGKTKAKESFGGLRPFHPCRSAFVRIRFVPPWRRYILKAAISRFTQKKMEDIISDDERQRGLRMEFAEYDEICELALELQKKGILDLALTTQDAANTKRGLATLAEAEAAERQGGIDYVNSDTGYDAFNDASSVSTETTVGGHTI